MSKLTKDRSSEGSGSEIDTKADLQFKDCRKLVKFNTKQKQRLKEIWGPLQAKEDEKTQVEKIIILFVLFIL
jgi:hypothetical protein